MDITKCTRKRGLVEEYLTKLASGNQANVYFLQDVGKEGKNLIGKANRLKGKNYVLVNSSTTNSARSVALLVGANWVVNEEFRNQEGSVVAATLLQSNMMVGVLRSTSHQVWMA